MPTTTEISHHSSYRAGLILCTSFLFFSYKTNRGTNHHNQSWQHLEAAASFPSILMMFHSTIPMLFYHLRSHHEPLILSAKIPHPPILYQLSSQNLPTSFPQESNPLRFLGSESIACRIRRLNCIYRDITFRAWRSSGSKTEFEKIRNGSGRYFLYAWAKNEKDFDSFLI